MRFDLIKDFKAILFEHLADFLFVCLFFFFNFFRSGLADCETIACEQALLFGYLERERASERRSSEGQRKGELATISHKISFVLRLDEGKYHWLKNDVPENKVD